MKVEEKKDWEFEKFSGTRLKGSGSQVFLLSPISQPCLHLQRARMGSIISLHESKMIYICPLPFKDLPLVLNVMCVEV